MKYVWKWERRFSFYASRINKIWLNSSTQILATEALKIIVIEFQIKSVVNF